MRDSSIGIFKKQKCFYLLPAYLLTDKHDESIVIIRNYRSHHIQVVELHQYSIQTGIFAQK